MAALAADLGVRRTPALMNCPNCGLSSPEGTERCDCGYDFRTGALGAHSKSTGSRERIDLPPATVLDQALLAALLQKRFQDCLIGDLDAPNGILLGSPLRRRH